MPIIRARTVSLRRGKTEGRGGRRGSKDKDAEDKEETLRRATSLKLRLTQARKSPLSEAVTSSSTAAMNPSSEGGEGGGGGGSIEQNPLAKLVSGIEDHSGSCDSGATFHSAAQSTGEMHPVQDVPSYVPEAHVVSSGKYPPHSAVEYRPKMEKIPFPPWPSTEDQHQSDKPSPDDLPALPPSPPDSDLESDGEGYEDPEIREYPRGMEYEDEVLRPPEGAELIRSDSKVADSSALDSLITQLRAVSKSIPARDLRDNTASSLYRPVFHSTSSWIHKADDPLSDLPLRADESSSSLMASPSLASTQAVISLPATVNQCKEG